MGFFHKQVGILGYFQLGKYIGKGPHGRREDSLENFVFLSLIYFANFAFFKSYFCILLIFKDIQKHI